MQTVVIILVLALLIIFIAVGARKKSNNHLSDYLSSSNPSDPQDHLYPDSQDLSGTIKLDTIITGKYLDGIATVKGINNQNNELLIHFTPRSSDPCYYETWDIDLTLQQVKNNKFTLS